VTNPTALQPAALEALDDRRLHELIAVAAGLLAYREGGFAPETAKMLRRIAGSLERRPRRPHADPYGVKPSMLMIASEVANEYGLPLEALRSQTRRRSIVWARHEAMRRIDSTGYFSTTAIGQFFGGRDHTTVIHAVRVATARKAASAMIAKIPEVLSRHIGRVYYP
jgi:chromosomal replication initiation ATPase DnaA